MFKRKDWVHSKKGRGGGLEDSSSSGSSSEDDGGSDVERDPIHRGSERDDEEDEEDEEEEESSGSEELDADDLAALEDDDDEDDDDEDDEDGPFGVPDEEDTPDVQARAWHEAGRGGAVVKGRALTCAPCGRTKKVLLLNSVMLYQHLTSKHHKKLEKAEGCEQEPYSMFRYADEQTRKGLVSGGETHAERLARIKRVSKSSENSARKEQKPRKARPGKRQRAELKAAREKEKEKEKA